jgi:hypothetical protein
MEKGLYNAENCRFVEQVWTKLGSFGMPHRMMGPALL